MNKLFIIGNGFDLAHGYKTSYKDFLLWYFNQAISSFKINGTYNDKYFISKIIKLPDGIDLIEHLDHIKHLTEIGKNGNFINLEDSFVKYVVTDLATKNWVDIEQTYFDLLVKILSEKYDAKENKIKSIISLNESLNFLKNKFCDYLKTLSFNLKIENNGPVFNIEMLLEEYLSVNNKYELINKKILFLNFNYTDTILNLTNSIILNKYLSQIKYDVLNIHGSLSNPNNPIIFGYGDEIDENYKIIENYNNNELLKNMKSFGYFLSPNYQKLLSFIKSAPFEIHLMGHSCGLSDRVLLNSIFENDNCQKIKVHYHDKRNGINNFTDLTMNISRHFNDKAKMRQRVEPITSCTPLG